jgi:hypothetical protein
MLNQDIHEAGCTSHDLEWVPASSRQALPGALKPTLGGTAPMGRSDRISGQSSRVDLVERSAAVHCSANTSPVLPSVVQVGHPGWSNDLATAGRPVRMNR